MSETMPTDAMNEMIAVPRWALEFILENAEFQDEGPPGEGWRSNDMEKAVSSLTTSLLKAVIKVDA